eukprot:s3239_g8.t1
MIHRNWACSSSIWPKFLMQSFLYYLLVATSSLDAASSIQLSDQRCSPYPHVGEMDCQGAHICGILALEMGTGDGVYHARVPEVHGLWPSVPPYGNSPCVAPMADADPKELARCYKPLPGSHETIRHQSWFENHEWEKHGRCAGMTNAADYFNQTCSLSVRPLEVMEGIRAAGGSVVDAAEQLQRLGICVNSLGTHDQIYLSACAGPDGKWKLADISKFSSVCGGQMR